MESQAPAWHSRAQQAEPCRQELPGADHLPPASAGTGHGAKASSPAHTRSAPHPSQYRARQGRRALGRGQTQIGFFSSARLSSARLHVCS